MSEAKAIKTPTDIERAVEEWLVTQIDAFRTARRQSMRYIFLNPAATVAIFKGALSRTTMTSFKVTCPLHVQLMMIDAGGEEVRREKMYPLVMAVLRVLPLQRFGLKIKDIIPVSFSEVTTEEDFKNNKIVYDLEFSVSFYVTISEDEDADTLLTVALNYLLQPGDNVADASDTIALEAQQ